MKHETKHYEANIDLMGEEHALVRGWRELDAEGTPLGDGWWHDPDTMPLHLVRWLGGLDVNNFLSDPLSVQHVRLVHPDGIFRADIPYEIPELSDLALSKWEREESHNTDPDWFFIISFRSEEAGDDEESHIDLEAYAYKTETMNGPFDGFIVQAIVNGPHFTLATGQEAYHGITLDEAKQRAANSVDAVLDGWAMSKVYPTNMEELYYEVYPGGWGGSADTSTNEPQPSHE